ncbi:ATP-binding protein [Streptomyces sp. RFCAC02]|uniref:ATP-binding protein n=1 Tax=Streptomyces sp. RFCAC02 TaxID=2499143 RepID=UPI00101F2B0E|nr:ATP-binding protein [Streptomyces sp. RFCAC02]
MNATRPFPAGGDHGPEPRNPATDGTGDGAEPVLEEQAPAEQVRQAADPRDGDPQAGPSDDGRGPAEPLLQVRRLHLVDTAGVVARAREFLREALHDWGWMPSRTEEQRASAEDALLVVSELVTNACLHADGPQELLVGRGAKRLRIEVVDGSAADPALRTTRRAGRPGGHGMFIVERLCLDWGVSHDGASGGKTVWAEVAAPPGLA